MCNPKISSLLKALQKEFVNGCPNLSDKLVTKYLNLSSATARGHMKCPKKGIRSTSKKAKTKGNENVQPVSASLPQIVPPHLLQYNKEPQPYPGLAYGVRLEGVNIIPDDELIANIFCFGAFADKSVVLSSMTSSEIPPSCRSMAVSAFLFCTIMRLTQYWSRPLPMLTTIAFIKLTITRRSSKY
jgi:hypothetical protein